MMSDLQELYQEVILDHNRRPRNFRALDDARKAEGYNPLCGDRLTVYLRVDDGVIKEATFQGSGCAISKASASLMTESVKGKTVAVALGGLLSGSDCTSRAAIVDISARAWASPTPAFIFAITVTKY